MSASRKLLHDALLIIQRDLMLAENAVGLTMTDITDSDENFDRRLSNLAEQAGDLQAQIDKLCAARDVILIERSRMLTARRDGHDAVTALKRRIKELSLQEKTVQVALLQSEIDNA